MRSQFANRNLCESHTITVYIREYEKVPFVVFTYCCELNFEIVKYPLSEVCKNFDFYFEKCVNIIKSLKLCNNCNKACSDDLIWDPSTVSISNGMNYKCSHGCKYCVAKEFTMKHYPVYTRYQEYGHQFLEALLSSKKLTKVCPACQGEPLEDEYTRNTFLFNMHKAPMIKQLVLLTNGIFADPEYIEKLSKYLDEHDMSIALNVNIPGFTKEIYEAACVDKFETIVTNMRGIFKYFPEACIIYIVSDHNKDVPVETVIKQFKELFPGVDPNKHLEIRVDAKSTPEQRVDLTKTVFEKIESADSAKQDTELCNIHTNPIGIHIFEPSHI